jgi:hypothetical protein
MNAKSPNQLLDQFLLELRQTLADTFIVADIIHELGPSPEATRLLPSLYAQLGTLQRIVRRVRSVLKRYVPRETDSDE